MSVLIPLTSTVTGGTQFTDAAAIFDFTDTWPSLPSNSVVVILGFGYNAPTSSAHDAVLMLAPSAAAAANLRIVIANMESDTYFTKACGENGAIIVPKSAATTSYVVLMTTTGKDATGSLQLWYDVRVV
jgi:hypothetical protein